MLTFWVWSPVAVFVLGWVCAYLLIRAESEVRPVDWRRPLSALGRVVAQRSRSSLRRG